MIRVRDSLRPQGEPGPAAKVKSDARPRLDQAAMFDGCTRVATACRASLSSKENSTSGARHRTPGCVLQPGPWSAAEWGQTTKRVGLPCTAVPKAVPPTQHQEAPVNIVWIAVNMSCLKWAGGCDEGLSWEPDMAAAGLESSSRQASAGLRKGQEVWQN